MPTISDNQKQHRKPEKSQTKITPNHFTNHRQIIITLLGAKNQEKLVKPSLNTKKQSKRHRRKVTTIERPLNKQTKNDKFLAFVNQPLAGFTKSDF
jgi:hypothetical protein